MRFIAEPIDSAVTARVGGKAATLAMLKSRGERIPDWFVLLPSACDASLASAKLPRVEQSEPEAIRNALAHVTLSEEVATEVNQAVRRLCTSDGAVLAVRSSAIEEDGPTHSFAGQFKSFLSVPPAEVSNRIVSVWRSAFESHLVAYREFNGLSSTPQPPAVILQTMVQSEVAGVAFAANPVSGATNCAVVTAVRGLGNTLVDGDSNADTWHISPNSKIFERRLVGESPILSDDEVREVASLVRRTSEILGAPQDIEWAISRGQLYLLQSRRITTPLPQGQPTIWDNSNIVESYSGVTTPLTFSFARRAYEGVYRQFCRILLVPKTKIQAHDSTFRHMLGLVRGRVYYNLLNWYRVLALLPGFALNRRFMEQMMGVKESLPAEILEELDSASLGARLMDGLNLAASAGALVANHLLLPRKTRRFYQRLEDALAPPAKPLERMTRQELRAYFLELESKLLTRWDAPLLNDFFAMIFYGVLRKLVAHWTKDPSNAVLNGLLCGTQGMVSAQPALRIRELADLAAPDREFSEMLENGQLPQILAALEDRPKFASLCGEYLQKFGERCLEELKLESLTVHDDPLLFFRSIGSLAQNPSHAANALANKQPDAPLRQAETQIDQTLVGHRFARKLFQWVLHHTRSHVRERENLRFERTRLYGRVRRIFVELGKRFVVEDWIDNPRDVFYLELDEVLDAAEGVRPSSGAETPERCIAQRNDSTSSVDYFCARGRALPENLRALITERQSQFADFRSAEAPPNRITSWGDASNNIPTPTQAQPQSAAEMRTGIGSCPGIVRARVRKILDPRCELIRPGEILVAKHTDPGWIVHFASIAGLLVERGSVLSHSAIVARELGIPAVVSIAGLTDWLKDGDLVELDGSTGQVRRIEPSAGHQDPVHGVGELPPTAVPLLSRGQVEAGAV